MLVEQEELEVIAVMVVMADLTTKLEMMAKVAVAVAEAAEDRSTYLVVEVV